MILTWKWHTFAILQKKATSHNLYTDDWTYDSDWTINAGSNNNKAWEYCKLGGRAITNFDAYVEAVSSFTRAIKQIKVYIEAGSLSNANMVVNHWGVVTKNATDTLFGDNNLITKNESVISLKPTSGIDWSAGKQFKVYWNLSNSSSTNGVIYVKKIEFLADKTATAINDANVDVQAVKVLHGGQLFILRDGTMYDVTGKEVK